MDLNADEVLATMRELFPREYDIAVLTAANRRLRMRITEMEEAKAKPERAEPTP